MRSRRSGRFSSAPSWWKQESQAAHFNGIPGPISVGTAEYVGDHFCRPYGARLISRRSPTAYAVGCILAPLRGWDVGCVLAPRRGWESKAHVHRKTLGNEFCYTLAVRGNYIPCLRHW